MIPQLASLESYNFFDNSFWYIFCELIYPNIVTTTAEIARLARDLGPLLPTNNLIAQFELYFTENLSPGTLSIYRGCLNCGLGTITAESTRQNT